VGQRNRHVIRCTSANVRVQLPADRSIWYTINNLLSFARKRVIAPSIFSLNDLIRDMESLLRRLIGEELVLTLHLLLTDIVMPGMRGNLLAERLVDLLPNLKVLFMSGYVGSALYVQHWLGTRAAFLQKPFSPDLLARKLREVLDAET
jgi:CheY-like chemotaxis protein